MRVPAAVAEYILDVSAPDALCIQSSLPAQLPKIDVSKLRSKEFVAAY